MTLHVFHCACARQQLKHGLRKGAAHTRFQGNNGTCCPFMDVGVRLREASEFQPAQVDPRSGRIHMAMRRHRLRAHCRSAPLLLGYLFWAGLTR